MKIAMSFLAIGGLAAISPTAHGGVPENVRVVDQDATGGAGDPGTTWANAYTTLQDALAEARLDGSIAQIWVAAHTYKPDQGSGVTPGDEEASFELVSLVGIYGGFAGGEEIRTEANPLVNETILSGDIGTTDSQHVVRSRGNILEGTILHGFTITSGSAGTCPGVTCRGGGLLVWPEDTSGNSLPAILMCRFEDNSAQSGGAIHVERAGTPGENEHVKIYNCTITENEAQNIASAICGLGSFGLPGTLRGSVVILMQGTAT